LGKELPDILEHGCLTLSRQISGKPPHYHLKEPYDKAGFFLLKYSDDFIVTFFFSFYIGVQRIFSFILC